MASRRRKPNGVSHMAHKGRSAGAPAAFNARQRVQLGRAFDLGQQHGVGAGGGEGARVVQSPRRVQRVDARHAFAPAVAAGLQGGGHLRARLWLGVGRDRVLQVQDQHVGIQASGLVERAGVGAGHVERGAAGAGRGGMHRGVAGVADSGTPPTICTGVVQT